MIQYLYTDRHGRWYFANNGRDCRRFCDCFGAVSIKWDFTYGGYKFLLL